MILNSNIFVLDENLLYSATAVQILLSSETLQNTSGFGRWISFINAINSITSRIACLSAIYSASVVLKAIYVCNLLYHNTGHTAYVIKYPVHDMIFSALSASV